MMKQQSVLSIADMWRRHKAILRREIPCREVFKICASQLVDRILEKKKACMKANAQNSRQSFNKIAAFHSRNEMKQLTFK